MKYELGILGAGNMAEAIARAAIDKHILRPEQIIASDPSDQRRAAFSKLGIATTQQNNEVIPNSKQLLIAVKPQILDSVAADLGQHGTKDQIILSIMAGITTDKLAQAIASQGRIAKPRVIRIMPNTPLQIGAGMAGIAPGQHAQKGDEELALRLFGAAGRAIVLDESLLDAVTAVSGSGPAYIFYLAQAMQHAATELGLGQHADTFVRQTILGAAQLLNATDETPAQLRHKVTSPGGTTEAAIDHLDKYQCSQVITDAVKTAARRSKQLGE